MNREDWLNKDDSQRPLTDRGRDRMRGISRGLARLDVMPDIVLSSPYTRARETAEILAAELDIKSSLIKFSDDLVPMAQPSSLLKEIAERFLVDNLAVVGHEPHLSSLISYLLTGKTEMSTDLKKGGVCLISLLIETQSWQASLEWLMTPRQLLAIGKS